MTLRVTLEVVPFGDEEKKYKIGQLDIFNMGMIDFGHSEYGVIEMDKYGGGLHSLTIYHRRDLGAWELVRKTLNSLDIEGPK